MKNGLLLSSVAVWLLATAFSAQAAVSRCVSTSGELANAIQLAETQAVTIKVVQGNYDMDQNDWGTGPYPVYVHAGSSLRGGYTGDACTGRDIAANNTVLHTGSGYLVQVVATGDLTIEGITWSAGGEIVEFDLDDSLATYSANPQILIHRCVFDNEQFGLQWSIAKSVGGSLRIDDTLVHGLNATPGTPSLFVYVAKGAPDVSLINDTVVDGFNGGGTALGNRVSGAHGAATFRVYNSIFYHNNGIDLNADTDALVLVDNVIGTAHFPAPSTAPVGTQTGDPHLDGSYRPIESPASPVINSGTNSVFGGLPSTDLPGRSRVVGSKPDRGAYESLVDDGSVQTVINTHNSGTGSLRQAIINANATSGFVLIDFNISASCPQTIALTSALPDITGRVWIDGYTQPGSAFNDLDPGDDAVLCIVLDGNANAVTNGLHVARGAPATASLIVTGLAFSGFTSAGVLLGGGGDHFLGGNQFGGIVGFEFLNQVANGIVIGAGVSNVLVGGSDPANRNLIGLATNNGITLDGVSGSTGASHDVQIINNYVGVGWNASGSFTNDANANKGILISGYNNSVSGNVISYNGGDGVDIDGGYGNVVESNFIGTSPLYDNLGNGSMGVRVENDGHDNSIRLNTIAFNKQKGVRIVTGTGNRISQNDIHDNALLGIDLAGEGVTPIDDDATPPAPDYANRGQNFPVIDSAIGGHSNGTMTGNLTTVPGTYLLEVFGAVACDASGYGEGEVFMGSESIDVPTGSGDQTTMPWSFALSFPRQFTLLPYVSATVTDAAGNTSEFSNCFPYTDDTIFADGFDPALLF